MRYSVLAVDYDGTLASRGWVDEGTKEALRQVKASGRRVILATGRELDGLRRVFGDLALFDAVVVENGGVLHDPVRDETTLLCPPASPRFIAALKERGVIGLAVGRAVVATSATHVPTVLEVIRRLQMDLQVAFNREAAMVLPAGVDKASGLSVALRRLGLSTPSAIAIGDAENDHPLLAACGCGVATASAIPALKARAHLVTTGEGGAGVREVVARLVASDPDADWTAPVAAPSTGA
jgi:hydroxymethylpyrimidine pyrophosphatase-like HAD family hydrolase